MKRLTHYCPLGGSLIIARGQREMDRKISAHNMIAHGPRPLIVCNAAPINTEARDTAARLARPTRQHMSYSLTGRRA